MSSNFPCRAAALALLAMAAAQAHAGDGFIAALGYAKRDLNQGLEVEAGYRQSVGALGFNGYWLGGIVDKGNASRYQSDVHINGSLQRFCRDSRTGQTTGGTSCPEEFSPAVVVSADYALSKELLLGAGVRVGVGGRDSVLFATARLRLISGLSLQARAGGDYASVGLLFGD